MNRYTITKDTITSENSVCRYDDVIRFYKSIDSVDLKLYSIRLTYLIRGAQNFYKFSFCNEKAMDKAFIDLKDLLINKTTDKIDIL